MAIDFSKLLTGEQEAEIDPQKIFIGLNKASHFDFLRNIQSEVLEKWFEEHRTQRDNVIKLNVGSGKTLVGLLILQSSLNEKIGPSLYLAPTIQLAKQVLFEGNSLGLELTEDPRDPYYLSGEKICVTNVFTLFNGLSVFGVGEQKSKIGSVVIDDAHSCISAITNQFRLKIENQQECYKRIFKIFSEDLKVYNEAKFLDLEISDPSVYMEIPFWSWYTHSSEVLNVLHSFRSDEELKFKYPMISQIIQYCRCVIGGQYLEIEPHFPNLSVIKSYEQAKRRVFLTAMFADDSVIFTHFGADRSQLKKPIVPRSSQSIGERMILLPEILNPKLGILYIKNMLRELAKTVNVVVIVPSMNATEEWKDFTKNILINKESITNGIEQLQRGDLLGLTVLVNRYDGIDLPNNACRVLVLDGLPEATSYVDRIDDQILSESEAKLKKQMERIEQGMGRGIRSNKDYCVVILLGSNLVQTISLPEGVEILTSATKAQLELSKQMASELQNPTVHEILGVIRQCLDRDQNWVKFSNQINSKLDSDEIFNLDENKLELKRAFDKMLIDQPQEAYNILENVINNTSNKQTKAWLNIKYATFLHPFDKNDAQNKLKFANDLVPGIMKPLHGVPYVKLSPVHNLQAQNLVANYNQRFSNPTDMILFVKQLCNDLQFLPDTAYQFESAVYELGKFIGIGSQRPEHSFGIGPDNLWLFENKKYFVIECKNGVGHVQKIAKNCVSQLGTSVRWFNQQYLDIEMVPILIHPTNILEKDATEVSDMRVITDTKLNKLKENIQELSNFLANSFHSGDINSIAQELKHLNLVGETFENVYTYRPKTK